MLRFNIIKFFSLAGLLALLVACGTGPDRTTLSTRSEIVGLADTIAGLSPDVDPVEAERAAEIAVEHSLYLAEAWEVTDGPLRHNTKVNLGIKERGLCYHWAWAIEERLAEENFQTLDLHLAIANSESLRLQHSTAIVSAKGDNLYEGVVLDGWRNGYGVLFWSPTVDDTRYEWLPQQEVFNRQIARRERREELSQIWDG